MAVKSKNPKIAIKNPDMRQYVAGQVTVPQMTATAVIIPAGRLVEYTAGEIKIGTEQNTAVMGAIRNSCASAGKQDVEFGFVPVMAGSPVAVGDRIAPRATGYIGKAQTSQASLLTATAGGGFTNQPTNDGIEIVSSDNTDLTQTITLYGTLNGAATVLVTETLTLTGTTQLDSAHLDWDVLLGARLSAVCTGTITIREASANATITTIAPAALTAGIAAATASNAYGLIPRHDASDTTTAAICLRGTGLDGVAIEIVDALNDTTEEDHGTTPFATVTEILLGAVAGTRTVTILSNEATDASAYCGIALQDTTVSGVPVDCWLKPYWM